MLARAHSKAALNRMFIAGTSSSRLILESDREPAEGMQLKELDETIRLCLKSWKYLRCNAQTHRHA